MADDSMFRALLNRLAETPGDVNAWLASLVPSQGTEIIRNMVKSGQASPLSPDQLPPGRVPRGTTVYGAGPSMSRGEGFQAGRDVVLGQPLDYPTLMHELTHVDQARRWGLFYPAIQSILATVRPDQYNPSGGNPFELEAVRRQREAYNEMNRRGRGPAGPPKWGP